MGRDYSKTGCATCSRRRKKCDQAKPICNTCHRLGLRCSYDKEQRVVRDEQITDQALISPVRVVKALRSCSFRSPDEEGVLARTQASIMSFYSPATSKHARDLSTLWQITYSDDLVRNAVVACFSAVLGHKPDHGNLNSEAYGNALRLIKERISGGPPDSKDSLALRASINFLGLLDCAGPEWSEDPTIHWRGMAKLLLQLNPKVVADTSALNVQILEAFVYNTSCLALFSPNIHEICTLWVRTRIMKQIEVVNPEGSERVANSPLVAGEYDMYDLALRVTCLLRSNTPTKHQAHTESIDELEARLHTADTHCRRRFAESVPEQVPPDLWDGLLEMQLSLSASLSICLITLRTCRRFTDQESPGQETIESHLERIDALVTLILRKYAKLSTMNMCLAALMWPLQIAACAIRHDQDVEILQLHLSDLVLRLDPGHRRRLEAVIHAAQALRDEAANLLDPQQHATTLPVGLSLLRKPNGILS